MISEGGKKQLRGREEKEVNLPDLYHGEFETRNKQGKERLNGEVKRYRPSGGK